MADEKDEKTIEETPNPRSRGLGRGLSALFEDDNIDSPKGMTEGNTSGGVGAKRSHLPIEQLKPGQYQPRKEFSPTAMDELIGSIKKYGVLQPILVREISVNQYEIIAGERRWRAAQAAGIHDIPAVVKDLDDTTTLEIALIENLQRQDLNPLEEAEAYRQLMEEFDHTQESLAESLGKSRPHVANTLRLLNLPDSVKSYVLTGKISAGHARTLLSSKDPEGLANMIVQNELSVRAAERIAKGEISPTGKGKTAKTKSGKDIDTLALEQEMTNRLGTKVEIALGKNGGGRLILHYSDLDQLDEFLHRLSHNRKNTNH